MSFHLNSTEFALTQERIAKINARAAKRGFTGRFEVVGTLQTVTQTSDLGFETTRTFYDTEITGEAPSYNGWVFTAALDWDEHAGLIVRTAPGVESIDRASLVEGHCDHCNTNRYRKATYVVVSTETGEQKQVGSTCIKDFLGWDGTPVFISEQEAREEGFGGFGFNRDHEYDARTIVTVAVAAIKAFGGYAPANSYDKVPTKDIIRQALSARTKYNQDVQDAIAAVIDGCEERAALVLDYVRGDDFTGDSEYVINLKAIASADIVSSRNLGILGSAPQAYAKHLERRSEIAERESFAPSEFFGQVGDKKVEFTGKITLIRWIESNFGTTVLYKIRATDGRIVTWFASREALGDKEGVEVTIVGTIKAHDEYQGTKTTVLTRCKDITPEVAE